MLTTVVLLHIFENTVIIFFIPDSLINRNPKEQHLFIMVNI